MQIEQLLKQLLDQNAAMMQRIEDLENKIEQGSMGYVVPSIEEELDAVEFQGRDLEEYLIERAKVGRPKIHKQGGLF
jgi:hypothetical protein